ncbi:RCC1 and BTB domain-containing protein 1-like [Cloeon dipterum]|uniref:RCC1 and BTB domain-containing protein 1-like n=1 Tax=Cloeon dipterum TaxID=197152 RepID=UPI0032201819
MSKLLWKWANFGYQTKEIRTAIVFGTNSENVIIVLENDEVFAFGKNQDGCLGVGDEGEVKVLKRIENLCQRRIEGFECATDADGKFSIFAISASGSVFSWGENRFGQLGLGTTRDTKVPTKISGSLKNESVVQIFSWGYNTTSFAEGSPCKVIGLEGVVISKIVCGDHFTLALSDDGKIYSWGDNSKGQCGNGTNKCLTSPTMISSEMGRIKDIAATLSASLPCAAITEKNQVYVWGRVNGQIIKTPELTFHSSFDEVFTIFSPKTYQHFHLKESKITKDGNKRQGSVIERFQKAFNKADTADFAFIVEGKEIHVHKSLLTIGSDVFKNKFLGDWEDSSKREQTVEDHSYDAFYAFLKYFYTDQVDFSLELALAHFYLVTDLLVECEKILKSGLTVQNVAAVYEKAILFEAKDLSEFCFKFCRKNLVDVVDNIESQQAR